MKMEREDRRTEGWRRTAIRGGEMKTVVLAAHEDVAGRTLPKPNYG